VGKLAGARPRVSNALGTANVVLSCCHAELKQQIAAICMETPRLKAARGDVQEFRVRNLLLPVAQIPAAAPLEISESETNFAGEA
jgi:hypothetical protein